MMISIFIFLIPVLFYFAYLFTKAYYSGLTWQDMDLNKDGHTTIAEYLNAADILKRTLVKDGKDCTEYSLIKDGSIVAIKCDPM
jgi:hypothetical protein